MHEDTHPSNEELLLCADGELSSREAVRVHKHLSACWQCRTRMAEIESSIAEFTLAYRVADESIPPIEGPKALLRARLAEAGQPRSGVLLASLWRTGRLRWRPKRTFAVAALGALTVGLGVLIGLGLGAWQRSSGHGSFETPTTPRRSLTPGAIRIVTRDEVCSSDTRETVHMAPASLKHKVFEEYGMSEANPDAYEVDYLVTPELGGADDIRNLWPQSYASTEWNAHVKDALEQRLHEMVCAGDVDLATAQHDIATDWISAYKKYFRTDRPF